MVTKEAKYTFWNIKNNKCSAKKYSYFKYQKVFK